MFYVEGGKLLENRYMKQNILKVQLVRESRVQLSNLNWFMNKIGTTELYEMISCPDFGYGIVFFCVCLIRETNELQ